MSENFFKDLELSFQAHAELLKERKWQALDDLWELDCKIVRLEEYILSNLNRHPELYDLFDTSDFFICD